MRIVSQHDGEVLLEKLADMSDGERFRLLDDDVQLDLSDKFFHQLDEMECQSVILEMLNHTDRSTGAALQASKSVRGRWTTFLATELTRFEDQIKRNFVEANR